MGDVLIQVEAHDRLVSAAFVARGYSADESADAARLCRSAALHGVRTHHALKALHLDDHMGSRAEPAGCVPGAAVREIDTPFEACRVWDAGRKMGPAVAYAAMAECERLADRYGVGVVTVDNAFHYLWGGGYVIDSACRGYVAYTQCTAALAEVAPFGGVYPTLGTNPHSLGLPTKGAIGFPVVIDWATSTVAMGRVQAMRREGGRLPPDAAVDAQGRPTDDPNAVAALLPFGRHKGYGMALANELIAACIGGSLPTLRCRPERAPEGEKTSPCFYFQAIRPEALGAGAFAQGRDLEANLRAVVDDVMGHGNRETGRCLLPGELEHRAAQRSRSLGGLVFTEAEAQEFAQLAESLGVAFARPTPVG
ncbi:MAG: Ldh family oxidoreductase [Planctomycetota bacterium]